MDKNDFDIDFDFEKEYGFDPETLLNTDDAGDFDLSQFDDDLDPMGDSEQAESENFNFEDFDLDEELANADEDPDLTYDDYAAEEQTEQPGDEAYAEAEDYGEDVYFTRKNRQGEAAGEYDGEHPQSPYPDMEEDVPQEEPQVPEDTEEPSDRRQRRERKKPAIQLPWSSRKLRQETDGVPEKPKKPSIFSKFLDWYMAPIRKRNNPEPEFIEGEDGRRRRRRKPTRAQIIKEVYLPPLFAGITVLLVLCFLVGSVSNAIKLKQINDKKAQQEKEQAELQAQQAETEYSRLLKEAELKATEYDFDGAISVLESFTGDATKYQQELIAKKSEYLNAKSQLVEWKDVNSIANLSFHVLIQDPVRAFNDAELGGMYNRNFVTVSEFSKILEQLYTGGYVLVDFNSFIASNEDLTGNRNFSYNPVLLPEGKKPIMITETMVNYFDYMIDGNKDGEPDAGGAGFASKLIVDTNGDIKAQMVDASGQTQVGDFDLVPVLETFISEHPDFSYRGARATLAVTGTQGIFGYRTNTSYISSVNQTFYEEEVASAKVLVDALRAKGYTLACFTYGNTAYRDLSVAQIKTEMQNWSSQITPVLGEVDVMVYARTSDIDDYSGNKFNVLYDAGFRYFVTNGTSPKTDINSTFVRQTRLMVTGNAMAWSSNQFTGYFDCNVVLDMANRKSVPN